MTGGVSGDQLKYFGFNCYFFLFCDPLQPSYHRSIIYLAEVKSLAARNDRTGDFVYFGCGQNEDNMAWRLLQDFEQRVKGGDGKHVDLINDKHLELSFARNDFSCINNLIAYMIDTCMGSGIYFQEIKETTFHN